MNAMTPDQIDKLQSRTNGTMANLSPIFAEILDTHMCGRRPPPHRHPDQLRLLVLADVIANLPVPYTSDPALSEAIEGRIRDLASWIADEAVKCGGAA